MAPRADARRLQVGLHLPNAGPLADGALIRDAAQLAEEVGLDSAWLFDHLLTPVDLDSAYPYTPDGSYLFAPDQPFYDALSTIGYLAGATSRIKLGTAVTVPALRHALPLSRQLATLDDLCGGRLVLGAGVGWMREEFAAVGVPAATRADRFEELIDALRTAWASDVSSFDGSYFSWPSAGMLPRPHGGRSIPVLIGGHSEPAIDRAARIGDGWAITLPGRAHPDLDALGAAIARFRRAATDAGRDPHQAHLHLFASVALRPWTREGVARPLLRGTAEELIADVTSLADMGITTLDAFVAAPDGRAYLSSVRTFAEQVVDHLDVAAAG